MPHPKITLSRVYTLPEQKEGKWILVDKLWPRGIKKENLPFDLWLKEIAPSTALRTWYHKDLNKNWQEFKKRYIQELQEKPELIEQVLELAQQTPITLLYAAKDTQQNHALVLQAVLQSWPQTSDMK